LLSRRSSIFHTQAAHAIFLALREPHAVTIDPLPPSTPPARDAVPNHRRTSHSSTQFESAVSTVSTNISPSGRSHTSTSPLVPATRLRSELEGENRTDALPHLPEIRPCAPLFFVVSISPPVFIRFFIHQIQRVNERGRDKDLRLSTRVRKLPRPVGWALPLLSPISFQKTILRCAPQNVNMSPTLHHLTFIGPRHYHRHRRPTDTLQMAMEAL
jgi:hypothetical protein